METNFISGSENLYKYLVSIGLLLMITTVVYPLRQKQDLEIQRINTEKDACILNYEILYNSSQVKKLNDKICNYGTDVLKQEFQNITKLNNQNNISQFELYCKKEEIVARQKHISLYNNLFWIFFPMGLALTIFGFYKWLQSKTNDDAMEKLELEKLQMEVDNLRSGQK